MALKEKELFIPVDQGKLFCRVFGENNPTLIVLHGGPGLGQNHLFPQMTEIGKFSSVLFYDQRGSGQSQGKEDWQSDPFQTYVRDIEQLREAFGLKTVSLLAHSWGGIPASMYTLAYPQRVDKVIYLNSVPLSSNDYLEFVKHRLQMVNANKDELMSLHDSPAFSQGDPETVEKYYKIYFKNYFANPDLVNKLNLKMSNEAAINYLKLYNFFYQYVTTHPFDLYEKLKEVNKKSLIVSCDKDVVPLYYAEKLHKNIPASEFVLIQNSGHFPYIEQPDILFKIIRHFIASN